MSTNDAMNRQCFCMSLDPAALRAALASQLGSPDLVELVEERCPYLFSSMPVFISPAHRRSMDAVVRAVETVAAMPAYQDLVLAHAPASARHDPGGARGVFFGYDFHVDGNAVGLIEINTNAGGAMLNALMARAHRACCVEEDELVETGPQFERRIVEMFQTEWELSGKTRPLRSIAIVDTDPEQQYLYPEFVLFQRLFERHGMHAIVTAPEGLTLRDGLLWHGDTAVDLVYNRLTDFMLEAPDSGALRDAYLAGAVVVTPHPRAHALYANKRNLAILSDRAALQRLGVPLAIQDILIDAILATRIVTPENAEQLWQERRQLFFKPLAGFGGRAAYRGEKLTRRVWQVILAGDYVAQKMMVPGERVIGSKDNPETLKFDLRLYAYGGATQWVAARMYQGQTTNFRTPGGGFAPVYSLPLGVSACEGPC
ncbi:MAG: hypothetical protein V4484_12880 [Pseudomonadota bacterium]